MGPTTLQWEINECLPRCLPFPYERELLSRCLFIYLGSVLYVAPSYYAFSGLVFVYWDLVGSLCSVLSNFLLSFYLSACLSLFLFVCLSFLCLFLSISIHSSLLSLSYSIPLYLSLLPSFPPSLSLILPRSLHSSFSLPIFVPLFPSFLPPYRTFSLFLAIIFPHLRNS